MVRPKRGNSKVHVESLLLRKVFGNPMTDEHGYRLRVSGDDAAYLYLPLATRQGQARVARSIDVTGAIEGYCGPDIRVDLDEMGRPLGIEIVE
jgi:uncharacterized protein YuzE